MSSLLLALLIALQTQSGSTGLDDVLQRATDYVAKYEADLGNLIGAEEYVQNAAWTTNGRMSVIAKKQQRRTSSDFLILQFGPQWAALRKVNRVDGSKVNQKEPSLEESFEDTPRANAKRLRSLIEESRAYNIGDVLREINVPTFALAVLRKDEFGRFSFEKAGSEKVNGVPTWEIRFREVTPPTLVVNGISSTDGGVVGKNESLFSSGTLWIEPNTGQVLKTEFVVENPYTHDHIKARVVVTYNLEKKVDMLVPGLMLEHYEAGNNTVDCRAEYANFRRFEVDVKVDMGVPPPPKP